jgi:hypothetical protein
LNAAKVDWYFTMPVMLKTVPVPADIIPS